MAIIFTCGCGKPLRAKEDAGGKKTKCPHCGAVVSIPAAATVAAGVATVASGIATEGEAPISVADWNLLHQAPEPIPAATPAPAASPAEAPAAEVSVGRQYKVLTHKEMGFVAKFDPGKLEQTLNGLSRQGWRVLSAVTMDMPGHVGHHDELVLILER